MNEQSTNMKKNIMWNTFGSVFYSVCQWLITILVVHLADFEAAGYLGLAMTTSSSFSAISLFSMRNFQVSDVHGEYSSNIYVGSRILTCITAFVCCAGAAFYGNSLYQVLCIDAFMLVRVAEALSDVMHGVNQKYDRYDLIGKSYILRGLATVVISTAGLILTKNLLLSLVIMAVVNLIISFLFDCRKTGKLEEIRPIVFDKKVMKLLKICAPIVIFSFLLSLENLIPKNVLQQIEGYETLGIYSSIASPTLVVQVFASVAFNPLLPQLSRYYVEKDYDRYHSMMLKIYAALAGMCVIVTIGAMLLGRLGLTILFGKDSAALQNYHLFLPIVWCTILTALIWILSAIVVAIRQIKWLLIGMVVDFILCIALVRPCIERLGSNGVSIVQIIVMSIYTLFLVVVCEVTYHKVKKNK